MPEYKLNVYKELMWSLELVEVEGAQFEDGKKYDKTLGWQENFGEQTTFETSFGPFPTPEALQEAARRFDEEDMPDGQPINPWVGASYADLMVGSEVEPQIKSASAT